MQASKESGIDYPHGLLYQFYDLACEVTETLMTTQQILAKMQMDVEIAGREVHALADVAFAYMRRERDRLRPGS